MLIAERWIVAALRHRTFFHLAELNTAIGELLKQLNGRRFRKLPGSRRTLFETLDKLALRPLPAPPYVFAEWQRARLTGWGATIGPATAALISAILASRPHPEQGYRSCLGLLRLSRQYSGGRLEAACARALAIRALSYKSVQSILRTGLDRQALVPVCTPPRPAHDHVRGPAYYTHQEVSDVA